MLLRALVLTIALLLLPTANSAGADRCAVARRDLRGAPTGLGGAHSGISDSSAGRLFGSSASLGIVELDPATGTVLNRFDPPAPQGVADGLAFSGTYLFYLSGSRDSDRLHVIDPDTGVLQRSLDLEASAFRNGLAFLDGLVYVLDWSALTQQIHAIDPSDGRVVRRLDIDGTNPDAPAISGGLAGVTGPDAILVTTVGTNEVLEIHPTTGGIVGRFEHGSSGASGLATVSGRIYLGTNTSRDVHVYSRDGQLDSTVTVEGAVGFQSLGGDGPHESLFALHVPFLELRR